MENDEYLRFLEGSFKTQGFDDLTSKIVAILYSEPEEVALDELAQRTGYSLSSISTSLKFMENFKCVRRIKKPGSRKIFFFMEKNIIQHMKTMIKGKLNDFLIAEETLPKLIKSSEDKNKTKIMKDQYEQIIFLKEVFKSSLEKLEKNDKK